MVSNESSDWFAEDNEINSYPFLSENLNSELLGSSIENNNLITENKEGQRNHIFYLFKLINIFIFI